MNERNYLFFNQRWGAVGAGGVWFPAQQDLHDGEDDGKVRGSKNALGAPGNGKRGIDAAHLGKGVERIGDEVPAAAGRNYNAFFEISGEIQRGIACKSA